MKKQAEIKKVLGIAWLYTIITGIFTLLHNINALLIGSHQVLNIAIHDFLKRNTLWIVVTTATIIILYTYIKKSNQDVRSLLSETPIIGIAVGVLVVLKGISDLASSLPLNIISIESVFEAIRRTDVFLDGTKEKMIMQAVITNALSIVLILSQIVLGIFLIKAYKKRIN